MKKFTVKEFAEMERLSPQFVYQLVQRRGIRHERHGAKILIPEDAAEEYRQGRTVEVTGKPKSKPRTYQPSNF